MIISLKQKSPVWLLFGILGKRGIIKYSETQLGLGHGRVPWRTFLTILDQEPFSSTWTFPLISLQAVTFCLQSLKQLSRTFIIIKGGWNFFISTKSTYSVGFLHDSSNGLRWTKPVEHEDNFFAASLLISAAMKDARHLIIYADCSLLKNTLLDPSLSPWTRRFQAWRLAAMLLNSSICSNCDVEARNGL